MSLNLEPRPEDAEAALRAFVTGSGWSLPLHPADDGRFMAFMALAAANGWNADEVELRLLQCGLPVDTAHTLGDRFRRHVERADRPRDPRIDEEIGKLNAKLGCKRNAGKQE